MGATDLDGCLENVDLADETRAGLAEALAAICGQFVQLPPDDAGDDDDQGTEEKRFLCLGDPGDARRRSKGMNDMTIVTPLGGKGLGVHAHCADSATPLRYLTAADKTVRVTSTDGELIDGCYWFTLEPQQGADATQGCFCEVAADGSYAKFVSMYAHNKARAMAMEVYNLHNRNFAGSSLASWRYWADTTSNLMIGRQEQGAHVTLLNGGHLILELDSGRQAVERQLARTFAATTFLTLLSQRASRAAFETYKPLQVSMH